MLVIHGAGGGYSQVAAIGEWLAASGFKTIAMSRFGYLRTPLPAEATPAAAAGARYAAQQIPGVRLIMFPTGGHAWLGRDAAVRDEVVTFLRRATSWALRRARLHGGP